MFTRTNMKKQKIRDHFKNNFVKPLYRKVKVDRANNFTVDIDNSIKLYGDGFGVKRKVISIENGDISLITVKTRNSNSLLGASDNNKTSRPLNTKTSARAIKTREGNDPVNYRMTESNQFDVISKYNNKYIQAENYRESGGILQKIPDSWLRVYPQPMLPGESTSSVVFRCISCQLGLGSILMLWTLVWVFVIHSFEGPYELKVSLDFEKEQNQLVIDLATELRQITPVSPKWRQAIEARIEDERQLTMLAVARGARVHPGYFWDLCGTFLFTLYVMTALGFGAPVPQTLWGRTSSLLYAVLAVPTHIYLMVNLGTCLVVHLEAHYKRLKRKIYEKTPLKVGNFTKESPSCSRNSELIKSQNSCSFFIKITRYFCIFCACRCVPLAAMLYYACGAVAFGLLRGKLPLEIAMFPLEFTTTGGLERVESYIRILYGLYVEGAMILLSCALAALRRHSCTAVGYMSDRYRLFTDDQFEKP